MLHLLRRCIRVPERLEGGMFLDRPQMQEAKSFVGERDQRYTVMVKCPEQPTAQE
jgi:hypothetical protein